MGPPCLPTTHITPHESHRSSSLPLQATASLVQEQFCSFLGIPHGHTLFVPAIGAFNTPSYEDPRQSPTMSGGSPASEGERQYPSSNQNSSSFYFVGIPHGHTFVQATGAFNTPTHEDPRQSPTTSGDHRPPRRKSISPRSPSGFHVATLRA